MNVQLVEDLRAARALIARGWCSGMPAADLSGRIAEIHGPDAARFCALGAVSRTCGRQSDCRRFLDAQRALQAQIRGDVTIWNDRPKRTQAQVLALFDRAIAATEAAQ